MKAERYRWIGSIPCGGCGTMGGARSSCIDVWLAIHHVYTNWQQYTHSSVGISKVDIERAFHTGVLLLESNPGGNSPTDEQQHQRCCHGLISELPLCIEALSFSHTCTVLFCCTFVISFSSSGWWIVANYCRPVCIAPNYASLCC